MFSALEMSDGMLNLYDIEQLNRTPHLVVLSACDTGVAAGPPGSEPLGFISAFLQRDTAAVVAATIPVPDAEAAPLMVSLHRHMVRGATLPEALQRSRGAVDTRSPKGLAASLAFTCFGAA
jgi:CHAT domain-containing protein